MKLQYLGDSKDSFNWDYHDYLTSELKYPRLNVALMLTSDDGGNDGKTRAEWVPAGTPVLRFCRDLQSNRSIERIKNLPKYTGGTYDVALHRSGARLMNRAEYFSDFDLGMNQIVFLDHIVIDFDGHGRRKFATRLVDLQATNEPSRASQSLSAMPRQAWTTSECSTTAVGYENPNRQTVMRQTNLSGNLATRS